MKKRNLLTGGVVKVLFEAGAKPGGSYFRINCTTAPIVVEVPTSVMHRLHRLGQAYEMRQLREFGSEVRIVVST